MADIPWITNYPTAIDTLTQMPALVAGDKALVSQIEAVRNAVFALQIEIGKTASPSSGSVRERVATLEAAPAGTGAEADIKDYSDVLATALSALGATERSLLLRHDSVVAVAVNSTVPDTLQLRHARGGTFNISSGKTLALGGVPLVAGAVQLFEGLGTITGALVAQHVLPQWFGCKCDSNGTAGSGTDDTVNLQKALDYCAATGHTLFIQPGRWIRTTSHLFIYDNISIRGGGRGHCGIVLDGDIYNTVGAGWERYVVLIGQSQLPGNITGGAAATAKIWTGVLADFTFRLTSNHIATTSAVQTDTVIMLSCRRGVLRNVEVDILGVGSTPVSTLGSQTDGIWNSAPLQDRMLLDRVYCNQLANSVAPYTGGMNLVGIKDSWLQNCEVNYSGDDAMRSAIRSTAAAQKARARVLADWAAGAINSSPTTTNM